MSLSDYKRWYADLKIRYDGLVDYAKELETDLTKANTTIYQLKVAEKNATDGLKIERLKTVDLTSKHSDVRKQLRQEKSKTKQLFEETQQLQKELTNLNLQKSQLQSATETRESQNTQIDELNEIITKLKDKKIEYKEDVKQLENKNEQMATQVEQLRGRVQELEGDKGDVEKMREEVEQEREHWIKEVRDLDELYDKVTDENTKLKEKLENWESFYEGWKNGSKKVKPHLVSDTDSELNMSEYEEIHSRY